MDNVYFGSYSEINSEAKHFRVTSELIFIVCQQLIIIAVIQGRFFMGVSHMLFSVKTGVLSGTD